jgi:hypothetical protein
VIAIRGSTTPVVATPVPLSNGASSPKVGPAAHEQRRLQIREADLATNANRRIRTLPFPGSHARDAALGHHARRHALRHRQTRHHEIDLVESNLAAQIREGERVGLEVCRCVTRPES